MATRQITSILKDIVNEPEIRAYIAGYRAAIYFMTGLIEEWAEGKGSHEGCDCTMCVKLREIVKTV